MVESGDMDSKGSDYAVCREVHYLHLPFDPQGHINLWHIAMDVAEISDMIPVFLASFRKWGFVLFICSMKGFVE